MTQRDVWGAQERRLCRRTTYSHRDAAIKSKQKKAGRLWPTKDDFEKAFTDNHSDWPKGWLPLLTVMAGSSSLGSNGYYWSSSGNGANAST